MDLGSRRRIAAVVLMATSSALAACGDDGVGDSAPTLSSSPSSAPVVTTPATTTPDTGTETSVETTIVEATTTTPESVPAAGSFAFPIVAIDDEGDAVVLSGVSQPPLVIFDGPSEADLEATTEDPVGNVVDHVSIAPDAAVAYVGTCCEPIAGTYLRTELPSVATYDEGQGIGYNPAVSPDGRLLAVGSIFGVTQVTDRVSGTELTVANGSGIASDLVGLFTPWDVMWTGPDGFAVLGTLDSDWVIVPATVQSDGGVRLDPAVAIAQSDGNFSAMLGFAGFASNGDLLIHREGDAVVRAVGRDGVETSQFELPGPSRSVWIEPDQPMIRVGENRTLTVGTTTVPGRFLWART